MITILIFFPLLLFPYLMAHIFNRVSFLCKTKWLSYIFTLIALLAYAMVFDSINWYFGSEVNQFACRPPTVITMLVFSPIAMALQFIFNSGIIKTVKFDPTDHG